MLRTTKRFVRGTLVALLLGSAPLYSISAQDNEPISVGMSDLDPGEYVWKPELAPEGAVRVLVSLSMQTAYVFRGDTLIGVSTISSGKPGKDTPLGVFPILQKNKDHRSNIYDNAPMPYMQRLTWDGIALHGGNIPGYPASHGCVRLPTKFAKKLFGVTRLGATVVVTDHAPFTAGEALVMVGNGGVPAHNAMDFAAASP